jgi:hypothetical protein
MKLPYPSLRLGVLLYKAVLFGPNVIACRVAWPHRDSLSYDIPNHGDRHEAKNDRYPGAFGLKGDFALQAYMLIAFFTSKFRQECRGGFAVIHISSAHEKLGPRTEVTALGFEDDARTEDRAH